PPSPSTPVTRKRPPMSCPIIGSGPCSATGMMAPQLAQNRAPSMFACPHASHCIAIASVGQSTHGAPPVRGATGSVEATLALWLGQTADPARDAALWHDESRRRSRTPEGAARTLGNYRRA